MASIDIIFKADSFQYDGDYDDLNKITLAKMLKGPFTIILFLSLIIILILSIQLLMHKLCRPMNVIDNRLFIDRSLQINSKSIN